MRMVRFFIIIFLTIILAFCCYVGNGQLQKDELYSMALRSKMFPKFHHYLKKKRT